MALPLAALGDAPPAAAEVLLRLLPLLQRDGGSAEIEALISAEPALCLQLLTLSDGTGSQGRATVTSLLSLCGREALHSLVLGAALATLQGAPEAGSRQVWQRSLLLALTARELARVVGYSSPDEAYLAGLLLRSGQLLMAQHGGDDYARLLATEPQEASQLEQEQRRYGATHLQLSTALLQGSPLSPMAIDALRYHDLETALLRNAHPLTRLLRLADVLSGPAASAHAEQCAALWFGLKPDALATLRRQSRQAQDDVLTRLGMHAQADDASATASALLDALRTCAELPAAADADCIWRRLHASLRLRFGLNAVLLLGHDSARQQLQAMDLGNDGRSLDFKLPCTVGSSLASDAWLLAEPRSSFEHGFAGQGVADEQIARLLDKPGLLCLPFASGVLVLGIHQDEWRKLQSRLPALQALLDASCRALPPPVAPSPHDALPQRIRETQHEIATPLTTLRSYLHLLADKTTGADDELRIMREELSRIARIVERIGKSEPEVQTSTVDLNSLLGDLMAGFKLTLPSSSPVEIIAELADTLPSLRSDEVALKQIFTNLIQNALEAMPQGGRLRLSTGFDADGQLCIVTVADTGEGIAPEVMQQLFQPKTSSKAGHSGLGLSIVKQLIDTLGGSIDCQSLPTVGTRFQVHLPLGVHPMSSQE